MRLVELIPDVVTPIELEPEEIGIALFQLFRSSGDV